MTTGRQPGPEADGDGLLVAELASEQERFLEHRFGRFEIVALLMMARERVQRERQSALVAELARKCRRLLEVLLRLASLASSFCRAYSRTVSSSR